MNYTASEIVLFITAFGVIGVNIVTAWRSSAKIIEKVDQTLIKTSVIEGHVNSKETKLNEQIIALTNENRILRDVIMDKDKDKALLAQSVIQRTRLSDSSIPPIGNEISGTIEGIIKS